MSYTYPPTEDLNERAQRTPFFMVKNTTPEAIICESFLSEEECLLIENQFQEESSYKFPGCGAETKELLPIPKNNVAFEKIRIYMAGQNSSRFGFNIHEESLSGWLQTYSEHSSYSLHADTHPGQSRKLTAVLMLSDPSEYSGGDLVLLTRPQAIKVPKPLGTICLFPSWAMHHVTQITSGVRKTVNFGLWGPPFQ